MKKIVIIMSTLCMATACMPQSSRPLLPLPYATTPVRHSNCYNGVGFFHTDREELAKRMPSGFVPRDGAILGAAHAGHAMLAVILYSCPDAAPTARVLMIATPIEDPSFVSDLRPVAWNWYEFGRAVEDETQVKELTRMGYTVLRADLEHTAFREGDRESFFAADVDGQTLLQVRAALTDTANMRAQSHRFWHHRVDGRLVSTRMDFDYHHSWLGTFAACQFDSAVFSAANLTGITCSGEGLTEVIESLSYDEQMVVWRPDRR